MTNPLVVVISTPLEPEHVVQIRALDPRLEVLDEASLVPTPR